MKYYRIKNYILLHVMYEIMNFLSSAIRHVIFLSLINHLYVSHTYLDGCYQHTVLILS